MGSDHKEVLDKYKGVYNNWKLGRTITLTHFEKEELARLREQLYGITTYIYCNPCIIEMLNDVFRNYNPEPVIEPAPEPSMVDKVKQGIANVFKK